MKTNDTPKGSSLNDVTVLGGDGQRFCEDSIETLVLNSVGSKNSHLFLKRPESTGERFCRGLLRDGTLLVERVKEDRLHIRIDGFDLGLNHLSDYGIKKLFHN